jgi:hypothetical protein
VEDDKRLGPLAPEDVHARPVERASAKMPADARVLLGSYVIESASLRPPDVRTSVTAVDKAGAGSLYRIDIEVQGARLPITDGFPDIAAQTGETANHSPRQDGPWQGFRPPFHDLRVVPEKLKTPGVPQDWQFLDLEMQASPRYLFTDRSFPWCTFGRVTAQTYASDPTSSWHGTGVMIGPRHVLMNNRIVRWGGEGRNAGWVAFTPAYHRGAAPFGMAYAERIFFWRQLDVHMRTRDEHLGVFDYVVCVLDRRIGDVTGWVGWQDTYDPAWNGMPWWSMVAYSDDFANGEVLAFQDQIRVLETRQPVGTDPPGQALILENNAKCGTPKPFLEPGAPLFGWWHPPEPWPRVVGMHSTVLPKGYPYAAPFTGWGNSLAVGGPPLSWLIEHARAVFP